MASHTNTGPARSELTTVITIDDALILFQPGAQQTSPWPTYSRTSSMERVTSSRSRSFRVMPGRAWAGCSWIMPASGLWVTV